METLFVYGTLRDPQIQIEVSGRADRGTPDPLDEYGIGEIQISKSRYPVIQPREDDSISGLRLKVTAQELELIDAYETPAYARIRVTLHSGRTAWVYVRNQE